MSTANDKNDNEAFDSVVSKIKRKKSSNKKVKIT